MQRQRDLRASLLQNLKKLREELLDFLLVPVDEPTKPVGFKGLEIQSPLPDTLATVSIHLPSSSVELRNGTSQQTVEAVLLTLHSLC